VRLVLNYNNCDNGQDGQGMDRNCRCITVNRDANRAAAGVTGGGGMGVSRFQPVKDEDQQNATQRDPAPEPAHFELCPMNDTHNLVPAPNQNIARVQSSINRDSAAALRCS
jgi:hypothetical protein